MSGLHGWRIVESEAADVIAGFISFLEKRICRARGGLGSQLVRSGAWIDATSRERRVVSMRRLKGNRSRCRLVDSVSSNRKPVKKHPSKKDP